MSFAAKRVGVWLALAAMLPLQLPATAATVTYNIVPASDPEATSRTIKTGSRIEYRITADVTSDNPSAEDNSGLAAVIVDVETDLGVAQPAATSLDPVIADNFLFPSLGTPRNDDLEGIGGAQAAFGSPITGVGQDETLIVARGFLQTPNAEGTFTVVIGDGSVANVLTADPTSVPNVVAATVEIGNGFTIITDDAAPEDPGGGNGGGTTPPIGDLSGLGAMAGFGAFMTSVAVGSMFGPWGIVMGLLVGSLIGLITLFAGSSGSSGAA